MRALTIRQPWADLIAAGVKDVENRTWEPPSTLADWGRCRHCPADDQCGDCGDGRYPPGSWEPHRHPGHQHARFPAWVIADGPFPFTIAVHAGAQKAPGDEFERALDLYLRTEGIEGSIQVLLATARDRLGAIVATVEVTGCHDIETCARPFTADDRLEDFPEGEGEAAWCSPWAAPAADHWTLANARPLPEPIPAKGRQGLWILDDDLAAQVRDALSGPALAGQFTAFIGSPT